MSTEREALVSAQDERHATQIARDEWYARLQLRKQSNHFEQLPLHEQVKDFLLAAFRNAV